jgi:hypothetical protein
LKSPQAFGLVFGQLDALLNAKETFCYCYEQRIERLSLENGVALPDGLRKMKRPKLQC